MESNGIGISQELFNKPGLEMEDRAAIDFIDNVKISNIKLRDLK